MSWAEIARRLEASIQRVYGEEILLEPLAKSQWSAPSLDLTRPVISGPATVHIPGPYGADIAGVRPSVAYDEARVEIQRTELPEGWDIRKGDRLTLMDRPGQPDHTVARVDETDIAFVAVILAPIAGAAD